MFDDLKYNSAIKKLSNLYPYMHYDNIVTVGFCPMLRGHIVEQQLKPNVCGLVLYYFLKIPVLNKPFVLTKVVQLGRDGGE